MRTATVRVVVDGAPMLRLALKMLWAWCRHGKALLVFKGVAVEE